MSWRNESERHRLSALGIKTTNKNLMSFHKGVDLNFAKALLSDSKYVKRANHYDGMKMIDFMIEIPTFCCQRKTESAMSFDANDKSMSTQLRLPEIDLDELEYLEILADYIEDKGYKTNIYLTVHEGEFSYKEVVLGEDDLDDINWFNAEYIHPHIWMGKKYYRPDDFYKMSEDVVDVLDEYTRITGGDLR